MIFRKYFHYIFIFLLFPTISYPDSLWSGGKLYLGFIPSRYELYEDTIKEESSLFRYSGYFGLYGRYPRDTIEFLTDINLGFSNVNSTNFPFLNQIKLGLHPLDSPWTLWIGRQLNSAASLHPSFDSDFLDGIGLDNQPFCIFKTGCFTTNIAQKNVNPYAPRVVAEYNDNDQFFASGSYTPFTEREKVYQEYNGTLEKDFHEISLAMKKVFLLSHTETIGASIGYTYGENQDHLIQTTFGLTTDPVNILLSYGTETKNSSNDRLSLSIAFPIEKDIYYLSWLERGLSKNPTHDFQIGYKSPIFDESFYMSVAFQGRTNGSSLTNISEFGSMLSWGLTFN